MINLYLDSDGLPKIYAAPYSTVYRVQFIYCFLISYDIYNNCNCAHISGMICQRCASIDSTTLAANLSNLGKEEELCQNLSFGKVCQANILEMKSGKGKIVHGHFWLNLWLALQLLNLYLIVLYLPRLTPTNNNLWYAGATKVDENNPLRHIFHIKDDHRTGKYEVVFTELEIASNKRICKPITILEGRYWCLLCTLKFSLQKFRKLDVPVFRMDHTIWCSNLSSKC